MTAREPISVLHPYSPETDKLRRKMEKHGGVLDNVVRQAVANRPTSNLLSEIYLAGLWHGAELMRQRGTEIEGRVRPRVIDRIEVGGQRRGRGRAKRSD